MEIKTSLRGQQSRASGNDKQKSKTCWNVKNVKKCQKMLKMLKNVKKCQKC